MQSYTLEDAQNQLEHLIDDALHGEIIVIQRDGQSVQLVPIVAPKKKRKAGSARGLIRMAEDFDVLLPDFDEYME